MRIHQTLKRLAARGPSPWPVLSVYVNTRPIGPQMTTYRPFLKKRLTEELRVFKPRSPEHESLSVDMARVQHYLDYDLKDFTHGAAVFACYADDDMFDAMQVPVEFPDQLVTVSSLPMLFPLLRVADRYRRAAVLVTDSNTARLFVVGLGAIELRREVRSPVVRKVKNAGEGDSATAQGRADEMHARHARLAAAALEDMAQEMHASWLLLGGETQVVAEAEAALSKPMRERVLGHFPWDVRIPEIELAQSVEEKVAAKESALRVALAKELVTLKGPGAALGVEATMDALRESRVQELVVSDSLPASLTGWACRACRTFAQGAPPHPCPTCGKDETGPVILREEIAGRGRAQGASVRFVEARAVPELDLKGGVGAFVRYR